MRPGQWVVISGIGGLGQLFTRGFQLDFYLPPIIIGLVLSVLLAVLALSPTAHAWERLRSDAPERYEVVAGDTLWDISARYLRSPWQWPALWQANPQIRNPHLIYPGQHLYLERVGDRAFLRSGRADGQPGATIRSAIPAK